MCPARPPGITSARCQVESTHIWNLSTWGGVTIRIRPGYEQIILGRVMSPVGQWEIFWNRLREKMATRTSIVWHWKWRRSDTLPSVSRATFPFGTCHRVCLTLLSCVLSHCSPTSTSDIEFCGPCHTYDKPTLTAFGCFLFFTSIGNNSRAKFLSWTVMFDVIPYVSANLSPNNLRFHVICFISQSHLISCVLGHTTPPDFHTCCVYYDSRPNSPQITISPSGWHRQAGRQWIGRRVHFWPVLGTKFQKITTAHYTNSPMYYYFNGMTLNY